MEFISLREIARSYTWTHAGWKKRTCGRDAVVRLFPMIPLSGENDLDEEYHRQQVILHVPWLNTYELKNGDSSCTQVYIDHEL